MADYVELLINARKRMELVIDSMWQLLFFSFGMEFRIAYRYQHDCHIRGYNVA